MGLSEGRRSLQERVLRAYFDALIAPIDFLLYIIYKVCVLWLR